MNNQEIIEEMKIECPSAFELGEMYKVRLSDLILEALTLKDQQARQEKIELVEAF